MLKISTPLITDDTTLRNILTTSDVIAIVGYSDNPSMPSYRIGHYLKRAGYKVYAVNPTIQQIDGEPVYPSLSAVPEHIDIVNVFRRPEYLMGVVEDAIAVGADVVWAQVGINDADAAQKASNAGLQVVMDRCIKVDHSMLLGGW
jgi:predicted CoA-binding protein